MIGTIKKGSAAALVAVLASAAGLSHAAAQEGSYRSEYVFSYLGFPVARAQFTTSVDRSGGAVIQGEVKSAGIARLFDQTEGTTTARAAGGRDRLNPSRFDVAYVSGDEAQRVTMRFAGNQAQAQLDPPMKPRRSDWIDVTQAHLTGVVDPLTATLVKADEAGSVCNGRTLSVYDGWMRADLTLEPVSTGPIEGIEGTTATCRARFQPIAGYRSGNRDVAYMRDRGDIRITFGQLGDSGYFAPVQASIGTRIGTIHVRATRISRS